MAQCIRTSVLIVAVLVVSISLGSGPAYAVLSLYDDFNDPSHIVRSDLWNSADSYSTGGVGSGEMDMLRIIDALIFPTSNPKLLVVRHLVVQPGATSAIDRDGVIARNAPNPIAIQADVNMILCISSTAASVEAGVLLAGFNDGTPGGATDATGDIRTRLRIRCTSTNQAAITWFVFRCNDSGCNTGSTLGSGTFGAAHIGQEYTLNVRKGAGNFVFTALGQQQTFTVPGSPTAPPRVSFNGIRVFSTPTTSADGGDFIVAATFDNVMFDQ